MADAAKKKRTRSPSREAAPKRSRVHSVSPSVQSPSTGSDHRLPSKSSSKTTHIAETPPQSTSLPTAEDWIFRVKVLSSANDLENDVFKDAVKGLVRICFPDGILEQLGPFVLQQHMREMKAKPGNIEDATRIFEHEMLQRLVSILAQYLDSPARLITAVRAIVMDSARAHSESFREDFLGYITNEISRLSEADLGQSTNRLISSDTLHDVSGGDENVDPNNVIVDEPARSRKTKKSKKNLKRRKSKRTQDHDNKLDNDSVGADLAITHVGKNNPKDKKISSTWEWDVDPVEINRDTVMKAFPRTADLFAYHALPTTKQKLGSEASRKDIRLDMQSTLDKMPHEEFTKWVESMERLINGDYEILARIEPVVLSEDELSSKTPASVLSNTNTGHSDTLERESTFIKSEIAETSDKKLENIEQAQSNKAVMQNTTIFRHLSTEDWDVEPPTLRVEAADKKHGRSSQTNEVVDSAFGMPILQLLWGTDNLTPERCISDGFKITDTIMNNLQRRVSADRIVVSGLGGTNKTRTRSELQNGLIRSFPKPGQSFSYMRIKKNIETSLVPWVVAEPKAFPELKAMPFVFAHTVPSVAVIVNLLFGSWSAVSMLSGSQMWEEILKALQQRSISEASVGAANIDCLQIDSLCNDRKHPETTRRALLERVLRRLAFSHRDRFPELKSSPVVKTWERKTGLTW